MEVNKRIAIIGGGPSGLFMFKRLVESGRTDIIIEIFERKDKLGSGMPYSQEGANDEHITNVSSNEIPLIVTSLSDWIISVPKDTLDKFHIDPTYFNEYKVLPRLLFGQYLTAQFGLLQKMARDKGIEYLVHYNSQVTDIVDHPTRGRVLVEVNGLLKFEFDQVIISTGHNWPKRHEGVVPGYFDSPYPPVKLAMQLNHPVAIKGSSLTAVDAIRTLARHNGTFNKDKYGRLSYTLLEGCKNFRMVLHTRNGMLPAVRFHLEDSHLTNKSLLSKEEIEQHIAENGGFLSLDYIFEKDFKAPIREKEPEFYEQIKDLNMEDFVAKMMALREELDPFVLLKSEYIEAEKSIKRKQSVYWKEMLGVLSFALNYPAKHLSAEDMQRLQKSLTPLISIVIAYIPQSSSEELLALHQAGILDLISVGEESRVEPDPEQGATYFYSDGNGKEQSVHFDTYIDCVGQPHLAFEDLPFAGLLENRTVTPAKLKYKSMAAGALDMREGKQVTQDQNGDYYLQVPGLAINDHFQVVDAYGAFNDRIYIMAVPYIGGFNPDYSGLDFSEESSASIIKRMFPEYD
ncbi:FAD/NAD(P)-binding protein [Pedobacter mucosus]|uniref:FAD/NAD(P)-binding protein n=1 Tax=Pedobacter mucosus TaxID=2895286 RepID=UPI001EE3C671|nr:FAD/NAD(P)-binding protein [Pedobacter mucosus]UKT65605.1 FAD/NAD(P)-binding protein [Pedobacter mucosus]